jgi:hypothetical protein
MVFFIARGIPIIDQMEKTHFVIGEGQEPTSSIF